VPTELRYTLDGTNPREGRVYDGPFEIGDEKHTLQVFAKAGEAEGFETFHIPAHAEREGDGGPDIDDNRPASLVRTHAQLDGAGAVFKLIQTFKDREARLHGARLLVGEGENAVQVSFNQRELTIAMLEYVVTSLRSALGEEDAPLQLKVRQGGDFGTGRDLKEFAELAGLELTNNTVSQA
jgi:hypothetical protein